ncbi:cytochrome C [Duganella sp. HH101]|uniref:cytochrome C n=1 Tax=Duganella sp. HH101 TaxID=1781066 RepID=UPI0008754419|nr:cytochrome C [Duganella sp. HH101]OFA04201.1 cytochrome c551 peroxidase precursor [Duganella sp. HH101]
MYQRALYLAPAIASALLAACGGSSPTADNTSTTTQRVLQGGAQGAATTLAAVTVQAAPAAAAAAAPPPPIVLEPVPNDEGASLTFSSAGAVDTANPFFKPFGNGRSCATCHQADNGWSIGPDKLAARFTASGGTDPVFRLVDGAVSPLAATATLDQKRVAYSMLLTKGLIRVGLPMPAGAEFSLVKTEDPYNYASAKELSLFRRPLPTTNLKFASSVMWDSRETASDAASTLCLKDVRPAQCFASVDASLLHQSSSAVRGHAEAAQDLTAAEQRAIVDFEKTLFTTQISSIDAGSLTDAGALGGPARLAANAFYFGINDVESGDYQTGAPFNRNAMAMFGAWRNLDRPLPPPTPVRGRPAPPPPAPSAQNLARAAIARGEQIFNNKPFNISGVAGFNDELRRPLQRGSCASCHDTPNSGTHSVVRMFNTGVSAGARRTPDMPLYTLRNNASGETVTITDPGAAMLTGKWKDIGRVKVPSLRGIESRSPYFHDGSVHTIEDIVTFYDKRFNIGYTAQEAADLAAFLKVL